MKKSGATLAAFLLLIAAVAVQSQTKKPKPEFTGAWLLDPHQSNSLGVTSRPDLPIKIAHRDPEFRVTLTSESNGQPIERDFVYFTDGRGEDNPATMLLTTNPQTAKPGNLQNERTKSNTRWNGNKIVTRSLLRLNAGGHVVEFDLIDDWKLSSDGKTLTQTTRTVFLQSSSGSFIPAAAPDKKRVYNRV